MNLLKIYTIFLLLTVNNYGHINYDNLKNKTTYSNIGFGSDGLDSPMAQDKDTQTNTAISNTITVDIKDTDRQTQDISKISNDTKHSHYRVQEVNKEVLNIRKDVAGQVGAEAFEYVAHTLYKDPELKDKLPPKTLVHGIIGGIVSKIAGGEFRSGATGAVVGHEVAKKIIDNYIEQKIAQGKQIDIEELELRAKLVSSITASIVASATGGSNSDAAMAGAVGTSVVKNNDIEGVILAIGGLAIMTAKACKAIPLCKKYGTKAFNKVFGKKKTPEKKKNNVVKYGNEDKIKAQMKKRGWTEKDIQEAFRTKGIPAKGKKGDATRYVHPNTGKSVVVDNKTGEIFHVGEKGFRY